MKNNCKDTILYIQQTYEMLGTNSKYFDKVVDATVDYLVARIQLSSKTPEEKFSRPKKKTDSEPNSETNIGPNAVYGRKTKREIDPNIENILRRVLTNKIKKHLNPKYVGPPFLLFDKVSHYRDAGKNGYNTLFKPSADRIDCEKDYVDGNIDIKTMFDNMGKGGKSEYDFNEYKFNELNNNKMKNQNNTHNTIQLTPDQDGVIKYLINTGYANCAAKAYGQYTTKDEPTITITTNLKQSIQTNEKKSSSQRAADRFNDYLKNKPLEELGNNDNLSGYTNITVRDDKGNDFYKLKIRSIGKFIVEKNIQLYKLGKSEYYITNKDYSEFKKNNKPTKIRQAA